MKARNNRKDVETVNGYISKERAEICVMSAIEGSEGDDVLRALDDVRLAINSEPAANVASVVHGHWETYAYEDGFVCAVCSACKWSSGAMWWGYAIKHFDFCPHCGAKMGESEEKQ